MEQIERGDLGTWKMDIKMEVVVVFLFQVFLAITNQNTVQLLFTK